MVPELILNRSRAVSGIRTGFGQSGDAAIFFVLRVSAFSGFLSCYLMAMIKKGFFKLMALPAAAALLFLAVAGTSEAAPGKTAPKEQKPASLTVEHDDRAGDLPEGRKTKNTPFVASEVDPNDPARLGIGLAEIEKRIRALQEKEKDGSITPEETQALEDYLDIRKSDQEILSDVKTMEWVYTFINMDPEDNRYLREHKAFFKDLEADKKLAPTLSDADLALLIAKYTAKKENAQTAYSRVKNFYDNSSSYIETSTAKIGELTAEIQENTAVLRDLDRNTSPTKYLRLKARNAAHTSKINVTQFILNNYEVSYKNLAVGVNYRQEILSAVTDFLDNIRELHAEMRRKNLSSTMDKASKAVSAAKEYPAVARLAELNSMIQKDIELVNRENNLYEAENNRLTQLIAEARSFEEDLNNQISYFKGTVNLARILLAQNNYYRKIDLPDNFTENLSDRRMMMYQNRNDLNSLDGFRKKIYEDNRSDFSQNPEIEGLLKKQLELRFRLLSELNVILNTNTRNAANLQISHDAYEKIRSSLNEQIRNALFWNPSNVRLGRKWAQNFQDKVEKKDFMLANYIRNVKLVQPSFRECLDAGLLILALALVIWAGRFFEKRRQVIMANMVKPRKAGYSDAPVALTADLMKAAQVFLFTFLCGHIILGITEFRDGITQELMTEHNFYETVWGLALLLAGAVFFLRVYSAGGVNERIFNVTFDKKFYNAHRNIFFSIAVIWLTVQWRVNTQNIFTNDVTGQMILFLISAYLSFEFLRLVFISFKRKDVLFRKKFIIAVALLLCITQMIITYLGYYYSAVMLCERIIVSLFIILTYDLLRSLIKRTFRVYTIKARLKQWQEEQRKKQDSGDNSSGDEDADNLFTVQKDEISAYKVSAQTVTIVDQIFLFLLAVILYSIWGDLIAVTNYLKNFTVYTVGAGDLVKAVTAFDLLLVTYALGIGAVVIRNLPGVMEVLLFNHWELLRKYNYSITTIITYLLIAVDASFVCTTLGLSWDKVQWLVAALSVGLGFGLQEIFANFVSGLILLFERPVRIGDIITINDHSGTVSRIRIRATTIVDFDRKEYVVPNRSLITSALTNWTLMDTVTRVVIRVGVGYDSDMDEVRRLLFEIAARNPYVMPVPEPKMYFINFGESNLDVEFYVFTRKTADRYPCIDSMNSDILKTFREHNIEIAFNQMDVYIKNTQDGREIRVDSGELRERA